MKAQTSNTHVQVQLPQGVAKHQFINIGDVAVFTLQSKWRIGKVLQFFYQDAKTLKARQCNSATINIATVNKHVAVVCSWFDWHPPLSTNTYSICCAGIMPHSCSLNNYILTLSSECLQSVLLEKAAENISGGILYSDSAKHQLACAKLISLSEEALLCINRTAHSTSFNKVDLTCSSEIVEESDIETWHKYGCYRLTAVYKSHLCNDQLLGDVHMGAVQELIKKQFPHINGLSNTLRQSSRKLKAFDSGDNLQIVHVKLGRTDHWVVISTIGCANGEVDLYDSLQQRPSWETQQVIARYLKSPSKSIKIKLVNVATQKGSTDCGLYAIAMMTSLANKEEPLNIVYDQTALRIHLKESFEKGILSTFPTIKKRRVTNRLTMVESCFCVLLL